MSGANTPVGLIGATAPGCGFELHGDVGGKRGGLSAAPFLLDPENLDCPALGEANMTGPVAERGIEQRAVPDATSGAGSMHPRAPAAAKPGYAGSEQERP